MTLDVFTMGWTIIAFGIGYYWGNQRTINNNNYNLHGKSDITVNGEMIWKDRQAGEL